MKPLNLPVYVPNDFEVPEGCERLEYKPFNQDKSSNPYFSLTYGRFVQREEGNYYPGSGYRLVAVCLKKYTYDWPVEFKEGTRLIRGNAEWFFEAEENDWSYRLFSYISQLINLPEPPSDAPVGTIIVKGEK